MRFFVFLIPYISATLSYRGSSRISLNGHLGAGRGYSLAHWGRLVGVLLGFPGHILWYEKYLSVGDKLVQQYFSLFAYRFPFSEDTMLPALSG